jgi:hypothetical protein
MTRESESPVSHGSVRVRVGGYSEAGKPVSYPHSEYSGPGVSERSKHATDARHQRISHISHNYIVYLSVIALLITESQYIAVLLL